MDEKKCTIDDMLENLKIAMTYCRHFVCIEKLEYDTEREEVICSYHNSGELMKLYINVVCDSNEAILQDVISRCMAFFC